MDRREFLKTIGIACFCCLSKLSCAKSRITIAIQPFENFEKRLIEKIQTGILHLYGDVVIVVLPSKDLPQSAYYKPRNRYRAEKLLDYLESIIDKSHTKILGLTTRDISTTKGEHYDWGIFGLGQISGPACVVSTYRLGRGKVSEKLFTERLIKIVNHELGHTFGLTHCPNKGCLMEDAKGKIATVDRSSGNFCNECRRLLDRILGGL